MAQQLVPTEAQEQQVVIQYLELKGHKFTAIPNETGHTPEAKRRAIRMKRAGVRKGFPDLVAIIDGNFIAIEMKRVKGSVVSQEQKDWIEALNMAGVEARICKGSKEAIDFIRMLEDA
jgi:hypothetical protein